LWLSEATVDEHDDIMEWADRRAKAHAIPELIKREWGINTDRWQATVEVGSGRKTRRRSTPL
jgi:hypothetical protein